MRHPCVATRRRGRCPHQRPLARAALIVMLASAAPASAQVASTEASSALRALVLEHHAGLAALEAGVMAAENTAAAAGAGPPARLGFEVEEVPGGFDLGQAGSASVFLSKAFQPGGWADASRTVAAADVEAARLGLAAARRRLAASLDHDVVEAAALSLVAERLAAQDHLLATTEDAVRARFAVGEARYVEVLRLRTERLRVQTERAVAVAGASAARLRVLALAPAAPPDSVDSLLRAAVDAEARVFLTRPLPDAPPADSLAALARRVGLARLSVQRSEAEAALVRARQQPDIEATLGLQRFGEEGRGHELGPVLGASVSLPFTVGGSNDRTRLAAEAAGAASRADLAAAEAEVRGELAHLRAEYEAQRERLALYDEALVTGADLERESALAAYRTGDLPLVALLDFERAMAEAELALVQGRRAALATLAALVSGASWSSSFHAAE